MQCSKRLHNGPAHACIGLVAAACDQRHTGFGFGDFGECFRRLGADCKEGIFTQGFAELVDVFVVESADGEQAADDVGLQLFVEHWTRWCESDLGQHSVIGINAHQFRLGRQREVKFFDLLADVCFESQLGFLSCDGKADWQLHAEEANLLAELLGLPHGDFGLLRSGVPRIVDFQFRHAAVEEPLIKKLIKRKPADFLDNVLKIFGADDAIAMPFKIRLDALAVQFHAELAAQHVEHPGTLWVGARVELLHGIAIVAPDDGAGVVCLKHLLGFLPECILHRIGTEFLLLIENGVVAGEAFVEPEMRPVTAGDEVTEPLVSGLVSIQLMQ